MANPQLTTYIKSQLDKSVTRDAISAALVGAGWAQTDIEAAFAEVSGAAAQAATQPVAMQPAATQPAAVTQPAVAEAVAQPAMSQPAASAYFTQQPAAQSTVSVAGDSLFAQPAAGATSFEAPGEASGTSVRRILGIAAGAIAVIVVVGGGLYWYLMGSTPELPVVGGPSQEEVQRLTQENEQLKSQVASMTTEVTDLQSNLAIFQVTTTTEQTLTMRGTLEQNATTKNYTLVTARNVRIAISNSKDAKVVTAFTGLVNADLELQGTYLPGTPSLKVTAVNGNTITAASSTAPAAGGTL